MEGREGRSLKLRRSRLRLRHIRVEVEALEREASRAGELHENLEATGRRVARRPRRDEPCSTAVKNKSTGGGTRTRTAFRPTDFKSVASAISPPRHSCEKIARRARAFKIPCSLLQLSC